MAIQLKEVPLLFFVYLYVNCTQFTDIALKEKLNHLGISGSLLNWARSFLVGREQRVIVEGMESAPLKVLSGVPQGP